MVFAFLLLQAPFASAQAAEKDMATRLREAFASPYGKAMSAELGKSLRSSADPACLADKGLAADQLESRGRDIVIKWGTRAMEGILAPAEKELAANPFAGAAELERLKSNPDVKRYVTMFEPIRHANDLNIVFENFDRYNLVYRVKLRGVHPLGTGNEDLRRLDQIDATEEKLEKFVQGSRSKALKRFLDLTDQEAAARMAAVKKVFDPSIGPLDFFKGVENDLAELCIRSGK